MVREKLFQITQGMKVIDKNEKSVGEVEMIFYSDEDPDNPGPETATAPRKNVSNTPAWVNDFIRQLSLDKPIPKELEQRLHREGFIKIDSSDFFKGNHYVTLNQIMNVTDDTVILNVNRDNLMSFR